MSDTPQKSFWDTKEGTWGMVIGLVLICGLGFALFKLLPFIITGLAMAATAGLYGLAVTGIGALLLCLIYVLFIDDGLRNAAMLRYKMFIRAVYRSIIASDPISVLRQYKQHCKERREKVRTKRDDVAANKRQNAEVLASFRKDAEELNKEILYYQKKTDDDSQQLARVKAGQLGRIIEAAKRAQVSADKIEQFYNTVQRGYKALEIMDSNIDLDISILEREYKSANAVNSSMKSIKDALLKGEFMDDMKDEAVSYITDQYGRMLGEADAWMDDIDVVVKGIEGKQDMLADNTLAMIENVNKFNFEALTARPVQGAIAAPVVLNTISVATPTSSYADLVKK